MAKIYYLMQQTFSGEYKILRRYKSLKIVRIAYNTMATTYPNSKFMVVEHIYG